MDTAIAYLNRSFESTAFVPPVPDAGDAWSNTRNEFPGTRFPYPNLRKRGAWRAPGVQGLQELSEEL